jgi:hypothetical protein
LVKKEQSKIYYYHNMLSSKYREFITPSKCETLAEIINFAWEREIELKKQMERGERRMSNPNPSHVEKQKFIDAPKKANQKGG